MFWPDPDDERGRLAERKARARRRPEPRKLPAKSEIAAEAVARLSVSCRKQPEIKAGGAKKTGGRRRRVGGRCNLSRRSQFLWVNYNDLTRPNSPQMVVVGKIPPMTFFRLVKYYNSPSYMAVGQKSIPAEAVNPYSPRNFWELQVEAGRRPMARGPRWTGHAGSIRLDPERRGNGPRRGSWVSGTGRRAGVKVAPGSQSSVCSRQAVLGWFCVFLPSPPLSTFFLFMFSVLQKKKLFAKPSQGFFGCSDSNAATAAGGRTGCWRAL